jgi:pimeloyl-ACP methyl ester carboxylesterase
VEGLRSRFVAAAGLSMHVLEAGAPGQPLVLLLHGFPELAYSWRHQMPALAAAGWHVVAPDQRGYGRTTGWDGRYDADVTPYRPFNLAKDMLALVRALGRDGGVPQRAVVVGHDFGSFVAASCALIRPDIFKAVVMMSAPFAGPPALDVPARSDPSAALAALKPPRQHYQWYFGSRRANEDMHHPAMGLHAFLRTYYHVKSADWAGNRPHALASAAVEELARLPSYYVMPLGATMPAAVARDAPGADAAARWLPDAELDVYTQEFARTGFQGGLNWYRCITDAGQMAELQMFDGTRIEVPACYIAGAADWGIHQSPGAFERMQSEVCTQWRGTHLVAGAGHWVQQEQPEATSALLLDFLRRGARGSAS